MELVSPEAALPGHADYTYRVPAVHAVLGSPMQGPWPQGSRLLTVGMGCFWGAERIFWQIPGVISTAAGYQGGYTPFATYEEVCTGRTGHAEVVQVVYDPHTVDLETLLRAFWENHDPTQGFRQGNDRGSQYRSAIYWHEAGGEALIRASREVYNDVVRSHGHPDITTELRPATDVGPFYYAEELHQQYLHKNPFGYCNHGFNGMSCPVGILSQDQVPSQVSIVSPKG